MFWIRPRTTDDRGKPSRVANHADLKAAGIPLSLIGLPLPGGKELTTKKQPTKHHWSSLIAFLGPIPTFVAVVFLSKIFRIQSTPVILTMLALGVVFFWWVSINVWLWVFARRFVKAIRPTGRCVRCLYDMTRCPTEDDDCRVCPECGSAWKIELAQPQLTL